MRVKLIQFASAETRTNVSSLDGFSQVLEPSSLRPRAGDVQLQPFAIAIVRAPNGTLSGDSQAVVHASHANLVHINSCLKKDKETPVTLQVYNNTIDVFPLLLLVALLLVLLVVVVLLFA